jgi:hypothetical protein
MVVQTVAKSKKFARTSALVERVIIKEGIIKEGNKHASDSDSQVVSSIPVYSTAASESSGEEREFDEASFQDELFALRIPLSVHIPLFRIVKDDDVSLTELATRLNNAIKKSTGKPGTWSQARLSALKAKIPARRLTVHQFLMICEAMGKDPVDTFKKLTKSGSRTPTEKGFSQIVAEAIKLVVTTKFKS